MSDSQNNSVLHPEPLGPEYEELERLLATGLKTCPTPELIFACVEEVLPEEVAAPIRRHISSCKVCSILIDDGPLAGNLSPIQSQRILARLEPPATPVQGQQNRNRYLAMAAAVVVTISLGSLYYAQHRTHPATVATAPPTTQPAPPRASTPQPWLTAELATLAPLPPPPARASDLLQRGGALTTPGEPTSAELLPAFHAYNRRDYSTAVKEFSAVSSRYPNATLPALYLGVSQLELGLNREAANTLQPLTNLPSPSPSTLWYLAVAKARLGDPEAASLFRKSCDAASQSKPSSDANTSLSCKIAAQLQP